jgi:hypothetical protein
MQDTEAEMPEDSSFALQVSISPTFYEQLLHAQIPKAQKRLSGSALLKAARGMLMKLTPGLNFTNIFGTYFLIDSVF